MQETLTLLLVNNHGADQPEHPRSLISAFVIRYLKSKVTRSDSLNSTFIFVGFNMIKSLATQKIVERNYLNSCCSKLDSFRFFIVFIKTIRSSDVPPRGVKTFWELERIPSG